MFSQFFAMMKQIFTGFTILALAFEEGAHGIRHLATTGKEAARQYEEEQKLRRKAAALATAKELGVTLEG